MKRRMALTTFLLPAGYHRDSWRRPGSRADELAGLSLMADLARTAERAKLDAVFLGDCVHANSTMRGDIMMNGFYEPISTLSALAALTSKIGLIGTMSTSFTEPYNAARQFAGLDHMSGGRAGWNVVTSRDGFQNFGGSGAPDPEVRYDRAAEHVEVVQKLWDSWHDDAILVDREAGRWLDTDELVPINHSGERFQVAGPINMPRPPQGRPVLVQAGSSSSGIEFGSKIADIIYTAQPRLEGAIDFYGRLKDAVRGHGRDPETVTVLPGIVPVIGRTEAEAHEIAADLSSMIDLDAGRRQVAGDLFLEIDDIDFDEHIPAERFSEDPKMGTRYHIFRSKAVDQGLTLRELIIDRARSTGHMFFVGTAGQAADRMIEWFDAGACDGFNLNAPYNPDGLELICDLLVPELQERGYFREDYEGDTLRDHLGLDRPSA
ncbi:monooxygenase [Pseudoclavibacter endophyticus]|uniref:NtaA/DmoA family FMN-dependent monooxygenase n=1 Tax=Pseudoclavibacter endophyticus TaxID=1778590 RepID=A0A6H9WAT0_9MICO|nr:NtaA/DmoA family FMN-dependent monooxygenase [Pseudoclavibacter endophyticus]KAB1646854.1 NtaA/DmoA family FMN-dependent monooxygenase [Pseudoclavibacter endophyticus]GGA75002.1 monooxygenase [Pseudoclavibacter endophyticus]